MAETLACMQCAAVLGIGVGVGVGVGMPCMLALCPKRKEKTPLPPSWYSDGWILDGCVSSFFFSFSFWHSLMSGD